MGFPSAGFPFSIFHFRFSRRRTLAPFLLLPFSACVHPPAPTGATPPVLERATTDDGWSLALHRYPIPPGLPPRRRPVVLCHGLANNRTTLDLIAGGSLARAIADAGFDVWVVELRGHGDSRRGPPGSSPSRRTFDDHVRRDLPALLRRVRDRTGGAGVSWVGHSLGGMVAYAHLGRGGDGIDRLVAIASPGDMRRRGLVGAGASLSACVLPFPQVYLRTFGGAQAALCGGYDPLQLNRSFFRKENLSLEERRLLRATALENVSRGELRQLRRWSNERTFDSLDGVDDYAASLSRIAVPALLVSGSRDAIAPPDTVEFVHARLGSADRTHRVFGRASGDPHDWGHVDLVAGARAAREVFPGIVDWLIAHDEPVRPSGSLGASPNP